MLFRYISKRFAVGLLQLIGLTIAVFFLIRLLPADPVSRLVGMNASPEAYAQAAKQLGVDRPLLAQLATYLGFQPEIAPGLLQGSLGVSWVTGTPVTAEIAAYLPVTLELVTLSFILALAVAVPIGMFGALNPGGKADKGVFVYSLFAGSQPEFWWGLLFVYLFFFTLGIAPAPLGRLSPMSSPPDVVTGFMTIDSLIAGQFDLFVEALHHLMLPVFTMAFILSGPIIKMVRQNMARALQSDFVLYANCAGLPKRRVAGYALRAAMAPSMTLIGILYGFMLSGAVLTESVFSLGGIGQYAINAVLNYDYPAIQAVVLVITAISLVVYLALDLIHAAIDPRIAF
ncbi:ABC transporter permease [Kaistia adipata]|uniref:ABC transporter permease n=1 Tax=Kaistia adipata TaxID=166954 RepID=UPI00041AC359|nr:ABC transporter permease [Kaistia adipata]